MSINFEIGLNAIASYRRLNYQIWYALAEYVDNSTQSYANHKVILDEAYSKSGESLEVRITYERTGAEPMLRVVDNAMGMDYEELQNALRVANPPDNPHGRCRYGMGLKTASCWIGNRWKITTKKLGETREYSVEVNVKRIENGDPELKTSTVDDLDADKHYTRIEIYDHNRGFKGRTIGKIKDYLKSMYRQDFRIGSLALYYNDDRMIWDDFENRLRNNHAGEKYKVTFSFDVGDKQVHGWAGVLDKGSRADAGFSILHSDRVVLGWPDAWRPQRIFGLNRNDLLNQRLLGEIHLDDFEVTHTKDNIQWYGDDEEQVEKELESQIANLFHVAKTPWKDQTDDRGPSAGDVDIAISGLREELLSPEMVDKIAITVLPEEQDITQNLERISEPVKSTRQPDIRVTLDQIEVWVYVIGDNRDMGPNDPYVVCESGQNDKIIVIINLQHPHVRNIEGEQALINYFRHCVYDAVAEWQAQRLRSRLDSNTVKTLKDQLLRVSFQMEQHAFDDGEHIEESEQSQVD